MSRTREPIAGLLAVAMVTWAMHRLALQAEDGAFRSPSSRGAGLETLVIEAAEWLGSSGVLALGALVAAAMLAPLCLGLRPERRPPDDAPSP